MISKHSVYEDEHFVVFYCPGCRSHHCVPIPPHPKAWTFNGDFERPTLQPSILVTCDAPAGRDEHGNERPAERLSTCHSYLTNGVIQYLPDCSHWAKGQTMPLPELPHEQGS